MGEFQTKFGEWLAGSGYAEAEVARKIGVSPSQVNRWKTGENRPTIRAMKRVREFTKGTVTEADWPEDRIKPVRAKG